MSIYIVAIILSIGFGAVVASARLLRDMTPPREPDVEPKSDPWAEEPTRPIPNETIAEITERWRAAQEAGIPVPTCDRPTKNIRRPRTEP